MVQPHEHLTYQLYQAYHKHVHSSREVQTYMHFGAVTRTNAATQTELLTGYMKAMIEGIVTDMHRFGSCWLLGAILGHELPAIHVLDYSAVIYVHTSVFDPEEKPRLNTRSIPYTGEFSGSAGGLLYADARALTCTVDLREERLIHHKCRALLLHAVQRTMQARVDAAAAEKASLHSQIAELKDRVFGLERELAAARKSLEEDAATAVDAEKTRLMEEARADAAAQRESAAAMQAQAEQAHAALDEELSTKRRQHEESLKAQEAAMQERLAAKLAQEFAASREALRQEFGCQSSAAACTDARKAVCEAVAALQQRTAQQLQAWQSQLFQQDVHRLVSVWAELYSLCSSPLAEEAAQLLVRLDPEADAEAIAFVNRTQSRFGSLLVQLEAALRDLGLETFTPVQGEPYDAALHSAVPTNATATALHGSIVTACRTPGLRMAAAPDTGEVCRILRRAEVLTAPGPHPGASGEA